MRHSLHLMIEASSKPPAMLAETIAGGIAHS